MDGLEPVFRAVLEVQTVAVVPVCGHWWPGHDELYTGQTLISSLEIFLLKVWEYFQFSAGKLLTFNMF